MITTFASTQNQVETALAAGATHLILEHSRVTIRSFCDDTSDSLFNKYKQLADDARRILPNIKLSIAIDILAHDSDFSAILAAIHSAMQADVHSFRVQDIGVAALIREIDPTAMITLVPEIGYHSAAAIRLGLTHADFLSVSNEVSVTALTHLSDDSSRLEVQVQGPIMIQYSYRRYLDGILPKAPLYDRRASDTEYPGRLVRFFDSPNGTVMFLYFDRCLLRELAPLQALNLGSWLVDGRGESLEYLAAAISAYRAVKNGVEIDLSNTISTIQALSGRPQRPGFFLKNNTDQDRDRPLEDKAILGVVRDAVKNKYLVIESRVSIPKLPTEVAILTSKGEFKTATHLEFKNLITYEPVEAANAGDLLLIQWISGVAPKSTLLQTF